MAVDPLKQILAAIGAGGEAAAAAMDKLNAALLAQAGLTEEQSNQLGSSVATLAAYELAALAAADGTSALFGATGRLATRQLEAARAFNETTGFAATYNKVIQDATFANRDLGLEAGEIANVFGTLTKTFTDFTKNGISPTEAGLAEAAMVLESVGVPVESTAGAFQVLRKALNQTDDQLAQNVLGLENFAEELGVASKELIDNFSKQMPVLSIFGDNAEQVFKKVTAAAKSSGMEFQTIMSLFDATDTFKGSTEAVGQLNALLGGGFLNATELLMVEDPIERLELFSQAFRDAGVSIEDLGRFQRKAFIDALPGIENNMQLTQLMAGEFDALTAAMDAEAKGRAELSQEAMIQRTADENKKVFMEVLKGVDGVGQSLDEIFRTGFTPLVNSAEKAREALKGGIGEEIDILKKSVDALVLSLGDVEAARDTALAEREERARAPTEAQGDSVIRVQVLLDGDTIADAVAKRIMK